MSAKKAESAKKADSKAKKGASAPVAISRLQSRYQQEIIPELQSKLGASNVHAVPQLKKIVLNMGVGTAVSEKKHLEDAVSALSQITGQKPLVTKARKAIAGFRLREGLSIGAKVTLRGRRMFEFLDRLISLALPRVRDFRGLNPDGFDGQGNYSMGLVEQLVFPELNPDKFPRVQGMNITFVTSSNSNDDARELLKMLGMPFRLDKNPASGAA